MPHTLALVGAPNTGKSTLFNALCAACVPTGNREGVTVEATRRRARLGQKDWEVIDLPGIRTLPPRAPDEQLSLAYLQKYMPDLILFVVDATRPEQGLSLAFSVLRLLRGGCGGCSAPCGAQTVPVRCMIVLNFGDRLKKQGITPHLGALRDATGIATVVVSATHRQGMDLLAATAAQVMDSPVPAYRIPTARAQIDAHVQAMFGKAVAKLPAKQSADRILAHPLTGIPIFLLLFALVLWLCMGGPGKWASDAILQLAIEPLIDLVLDLAEHFPPWVSSLLCDGIFVGVGTVLSFLPGLSLLFTCLCILEQSGLLARCAYLADRPMRAIGLSGQVFVSVLLGWGCTVPAVMSLRTVADPLQRRRAAVLLPLISCTARLPIYLMVGSMCGVGGWGICIVAYAVGLASFCMLAWMTAGKSREDPRSPLSLPPYRMPRIGEIVRQVRERSFHFALRVGSTVLLCSVLVWLLSHLTLRFGYTEQIGQSLLGLVSRHLAWLLAPIGLGESRIVSALLCGVLAKESIVSTLGVLYEGELAGVMSTAQAMSLAVFCALYCPCVATLDVIRRETQSTRAVVESVILGLGCAYLAAGMTYYGGLLWQKFL